MTRFVVRLLINAAGLWVAARLLPGISFGGEVGTLLIVALLFGVVNALLKPILTLLTCPLQILTLGLFTLVINGFLLLLTGWLSTRLGLAFEVAGFWPAFWGALVVTVVSVVLALIIPGEQ